MTFAFGSILVNTVDFFFKFLTFAIIIRIFMSWLAPRAGGQLAYFVYSITEPVFQIFRRLPLRFGMLDLTPLVALLTIDYLVHPLVLSIIYRILAAF